MYVYNSMDAPLSQICAREQTLISIRKNISAYFLI